MAIVAFSGGRFSAYPSAGLNSQAQALMHYRQQILSEAAQRWQEVLSDQHSLPGARHMARQALDSMRALEQLYRREEHLWTFHHLLDQSFQARATYVSGHDQAAARVQQYAQEIAIVDEQLARLRPQIAAAMTEAGRFSSPAFSSPAFSSPALPALMPSLTSTLIPHLSPSFSPQH